MSDIVARLRIDYCSCSDGFKSRRLVDPHCESCQTKDWRDEAADEIERLLGLRGLLKGVLGAWLEDASPDKLQWLVDDARAAIAATAAQPEPQDESHE